MNEDRAQELRQILAGSGSVTFIKSGQALSLRGDLVKNREYVRELTKLQASYVCEGLGLMSGLGLGRVEIGEKHLNVTTSKLVEWIANM